MQTKVVNAAVLGLMLIVSPLLLVGCGGEKQAPAASVNSEIEKTQQDALMKESSSAPGAGGTGTTAPQSY